jgi:hypothetical protein
MSSPTPTRCFSYEACDIPEGMTIRDWKRAKVAPAARQAVRHRRPSLRRRRER